MTPAQPQAGTAVAAAAPTAAPAQPKSVGIQIASGPSVQSLRLSWTLLSERHGGSLSRYQPRYTVGATEQGVTYDLVVGPFANATRRAKCAPNSPPARRRARCKRSGAMLFEFAEKGRVRALLYELKRV